MEEVVGSIPIGSTTETAGQSLSSSKSERSLSAALLFVADALERPPIRVCRVLRRAARELRSVEAPP